MNLQNSFLRLVRAMLLGAILLSSAPMAWADTVPVGDSGYFVAGVPSEEFVHFAAPESSGRQKAGNWCWAACIQMVLNYHGLFVEQRDIVKRVFGGEVDQPANGGQIMAALTGWAPDNRGRKSEILADAHNLDTATIISDLDKKWPLIVGLRGARGDAPGHAYVMTAAYFSRGPNGATLIHRVVLRDPWPSAPSRVEMNIEEFQERFQFATRVYVRRL